MNRAGAILVLSVFAAIWWTVGAAQTGHLGVVGLAGVLVSTLLVVIAWRRPDPSATPRERARRRRVVGLASAAEGVAIVVAVAGLHRLGRPDLTAPAVAIIVGLHFLPLARWIPAPIYYLTGLLLMATGAIGTVIPEPSTRVLVVGMGAAAGLWFSCGVVLVRSARPDN